MSLPEDRSPPPPPPPLPRDPLLDDPLFAELVSPTAPPLSRPVVAEPVEAAAGDLPMAEVVRSEASPPPLPSAVTRTDPLPQAMPVRPTFPKELPPRPPSERTVFRPLPPPPIDTQPPRSQWLAACSLLGCLGIVVIAAIALLAWIAITILGEVGDQIGNANPDGQNLRLGNGPRPGPIAPAPLANDVEIVLLAPTDALGLGGGGRFLFLRIPGQRLLAVFDVNAGRVVQNIPTGEPNALFAAGASRLYIVKPRAKTIQRFDMVGWQREVEMPLPESLQRIDDLAIGAGSDGPLYAIAASPGKPAEVHVVNGETLQTQATHSFQNWLGRKDQQVHARASHDGTLLGVATAKGAFAVRFEPGKEPVANPLGVRGSAPQLATPAPDGQALYTSRGVFDPTGKQLLGNARDPFFTFPTAHGSGLFLSLSVDDGQVEGSPQLHAAGAEFTNALASLDKGDVSGDLPANEVRQLPPDERVLLWPGAGIMAVLPITNNKLQVFKVDVAKELENSPRHYAVFATDPPATVRRGAEWHYTPVIWKSNGSAIDLTATGPIQVQPDGRTLKWTPPANAPASVEASITATIKGVKGARTMQKFRIAVLE